MLLINIYTEHAMNPFIHCYLKGKTDDEFQSGHDKKNN